MLHMYILCITHLGSLKITNNFLLSMILCNLGHGIHIMETLQILNTISAKWWHRGVDINPLHTIDLNPRPVPQQLQNSYSRNRSFTYILHIFTTPAQYFQTRSQPIRCYIKAYLLVCLRSTRWLHQLSVQLWHVPRLPSAPGTERLERECGAWWACVPVVAQSGTR